MKLSTLLFIVLVGFAGYAAGVHLNDRETEKQIVHAADFGLAYGLQCADGGSEKNVDACLAGFKAPQ
jgi:hypothetical protein